VILTVMALTVYALIYLLLPEPISLVFLFQVTFPIFFATYLLAHPFPPSSRLARGCSSPSLRSGPRSLTELFRSSFFLVDTPRVVKHFSLFVFISLLLIKPPSPACFLLTERPATLIFPFRLCHSSARFSYTYLSPPASRGDPIFYLCPFPSGMMIFPVHWSDVFFPFRAQENTSNYPTPVCLSTDDR